MRFTVMRWLSPLLLAVLLACNGAPVDPDASAGSAERNVLTAAEARPAGMLVAPPQLVSIDFGDGETARAWFRASFLLANAETVRGGAAQMDGAILVVSAADGPMPQAPSGDKMLRILVTLATLDSEGVVRFEGAATLRDEQGEQQLLITGSARALATGGDALLLMWDIAGSDILSADLFHYEFVAETRIVLPAP
jgi:hypothetical protein